MAAEPELGQVALPFEPLDRVRAPATSSPAVPTPDRSYNTRVVVAVVIAAVIGFAAPMLFVFVPMFYSICFFGYTASPQAATSVTELPGARL